MGIIIQGLAFYLALLVLLHILCVLFNCAYYRRRHEDEALLPMTVIKPLRGRESRLEDSLRSLVGSDREGALQIIFAMESESDPAYPVALRVRQAFASRDIQVLKTGPSRGRMGKIHNMIEALKLAQHPYVIFSDSDVRTTRALLCETSRAFRDGAELVCACPYTFSASNMGETILGFCFNHYFSLSAAALHRIGIFHACAGGWMGYSKGVLDRLGGLETFERHIADDYAISRAALKAGAKPRIIPCLAPIHEEASGVREAFGHVWKWCLVVRFGAPGLALLAPLCSPVFLSCALLVVCWRGMSFMPMAALGIVAGLRAGSACVQDRVIANAAFPLWAYSMLPLLDVAFMGVWLVSLFRRTVAWRGKTYRLLRGGRVEVLSRNGADGRSART